MISVVLGDRKGVLFREVSSFQGGLIDGFHLYSQKVDSVTWALGRWCSREVAHGRGVVQWSGGSVVGDGWVGPCLEEQFDGHVPLGYHGTVQGRAPDVVLCGDQDQQHTYTILEALKVS